MHDVIVIGSGPAGLNAALYTARANLSTQVIVGPQLGGQVSITYEIDNYLGFYEDMTGAELTERMVRHVEKFGTELVYDVIDAVDFTGPVLKIMTDGSGVLEARAVVVAAGASATRLGVPGEEAFTGHGVSYCATCDGAFFKGEDVVVVGGGDSAAEEALFLTRFASSVRLIHRRDALRAGPQLQERILANPKIGFEWNTVVKEILGNGTVNQLKVERLPTGESAVLDATGVFIFVGHYPNSDPYNGVLEMDSHGYILVDEHMRTNIPGVFAAGEIMDPLWRQVATSVGQGAAAGMAVEAYLGAL